MDGRPTNEHEVIAPCIYTSVGETLLHRNVLGDRMVSDAEICRRLGKVIEGPAVSDFSQATEKGLQAVSLTWVSMNASARARTRPD